MDRHFMKGNEAIAEAAIRAGCRFFAGYPITPQNEIPEYMSRRMPEEGGVFVQGESEVAAINMVFGAAATGARVMTSSSGPGLSLKTEGISYIAASQLPAVIVNVMRGGPGLGTIEPAQSDYFQMTKAAGHGGFRMIVLAPSTVQEAADLMLQAFDYADRDRNPAVLLVDGCLGAMMESVVLPLPRRELPDKSDWVLDGCQGRSPRSVLSCSLVAERQEEFNQQMADLYDGWQKNDVQVEQFFVEDAEVVVAAYGTSARIARTAIENLRDAGVKAGLIRPITLSPFPYQTFAALDPSRVKCVLDIEMTIPAQMVEDVRLGVQGRVPVACFGRSGGVIPQVDEIEEAVKKALAEGGR
jgi:2-oxoglutarate/2-oxoacid ferredoxin oxidoreductase subunit alpha